MLFKTQNQRINHPYLVMMVSPKLFNCFHVDHHEFISHQLVQRSSRNRTHHRFVSAPQTNLNRNSSSAVNSYNSIFYSIFRILDRHMKCGPAIRIDCRASNFRGIRTHLKMKLTIRHRNLAAISDTTTEHTVRIFDTKSNGRNGKTHTYTKIKL